MTRSNSVARFATAFAIAFIALPLAAQEAAPEESAPDWALGLGLSYLATSGNSESESLGLDGHYTNSWRPWSLESDLTALRASDEEGAIAESVAASVRGGRDLSDRLTLTAGLSGLIDEFAGVDLRTVLDVALRWELVETESWALAGLFGPSWVHEELVDLPSDSWLGAIAQLEGIWTLSDRAGLTARLAYFPNFDVSDDYRMEGEISAQATLNSHLALRLGHLWRYDNVPALGFEDTDRRTTASLVLHWGASEEACACA